MQEDEIAWEYDIEHLYANFTEENYNPSTAPQYRGGGNFSQGPGMRDNQHLIVWLRPSAHRTFRKLYGVIHQDISPGVLPSSAQSPLTPPPPPPHHTPTSASTPTHGGMEVRPHGAIFAACLA